MHTYDHMLDSWIIEKIKKEKEKEDNRTQPFLEIPEYYEPLPREPEKKKDSNVIVIEL